MSKRKSLFILLVIFIALISAGCVGFMEEEETADSGLGPEQSKDLYESALNAPKTFYPPELNLSAGKNIEVRCGAWVSGREKVYIEMILTNMGEDEIFIKGVGGFIDDGTIVTLDAVGNEQKSLKPKESAYYYLYGYEVSERFPTYPYYATGESLSISDKEVTLRAYALGVNDKGDDEIILKVKGPVPALSPEFLYEIHIEKME